MDPASTSANHDFIGLQRINWSRLPWEERLTVMWGWFWRTYAANLGVWAGATAVLGIINIAIAEFAGPLSGIASTFITLLFILTFGLLATQPLIIWLLSSRIGEYSIILCKRATRPPPQETIESATASATQITVKNDDTTNA